MGALQMFHTFEAPAEIPFMRATALRPAAFMQLEAVGFVPSRPAIEGFLRLFVSRERSWLLRLRRWGCR